MFKAIRNFFKWKCFICKQKDIDSKFVVPHYETEDVYRYHKDCIEKVLRHPENYDTWIVHQTLELIEGIKGNKKWKEAKESQARKLTKEWLLYISE